DSPAMPALLQQPPEYATPPVLEQPSSSRSNLTAFLAIIVLVLVSTFAFLYFLNLNQGSTNSDEDGDRPEILPQLRMMPIPEGKFERWFSAQNVKLGPFKISATEVTRAQYQKFTEAAAYQTFAEQGHGPERGSLVVGADGKRTWDANTTW